MTEDLVHLAAEVVSYLAPLAPVLANVGEGAAEEAGRRLGADALAAAKRIWARLQPAVDADQRASAAVLELGADPDDEDLRVQLRLTLRRILAADDQLAAGLAGLVRGAPAPVGSVTGVVVHGHVHGPAIGFQFGQPPAPPPRRHRG